MPFVTPFHCSLEPPRAAERLNLAPGFVWLRGWSRQGEPQTYQTLLSAPRRTRVWDGGPGSLETFLRELEFSLRDPAPLKSCGVGSVRLPFSGGWAGYISYDAKDHFGETFSRRLEEDRSSSMPLAHFAYFDHGLSFDAARHLWLLWCAKEGDLGPLAEHYHEALDIDPGSATTALEHHAESCGSPVHDEESNPPEALTFGELRPRSNTTPHEYRHAVSRIRRMIANGDVYQVNYSQRFRAPLLADPLRIFARLAAVNPVPYSAFLNLGEAQILSNSPERFLEFDLASRRVMTTPIKGTIRRARRAAADARHREQLRASAKNAAEHLMIVDLLRNDLGRVAVPGSVVVEDLFRLVPYRFLWHLESDIVARLAPGLGIAELFEATFPGGSVTGAPKLAAIGAIEALERARRGIYTGAVGILGHGENGATGLFSIAIRTAVAAAGHIDYAAGGGVVYDSDPQGEFRESLLKAREFFTVIEEVAHAGDAAL